MGRGTKTWKSICEVLVYWEIFIWGVEHTVPRQGGGGVASA